MIALESVGKYFPGHSSTGAAESWIFRDLSLRVASGESVVLIGPSGSGKSVLLKIVAGLLQTDEGRLEVGTTNIGMLFQKNALFDSLTVEENLLFPLKERLGIRGEEARALAREFLAAVGLTGNEALFPDEISGGMQKRLGIARALIVKPEVILYDEPTAGLDPITSRTIADLILKLRQSAGSTLLSVVNDMRRAFQLGDRIYLLADGKLLGGGTSEEIQRSADPAIRQFIFGLRTGPLSGGRALQ